MIARHLGVSKMTVSRALRGESTVSADLGDRVRRAAAEMGYRPDPEVSRMMTHLRTVRENRQPQALGFVWTDRVAGKPSPWASELFKGAESKAESLGYGLDVFEIKTGELSARRIAEVMENRGVRGFVLSPLVSRSRGHLQMPWEKFSCVMIGLGFVRPALNRVHHHHFLGMMTSMRQLRKEGFRRIGFFADAQIDRRMFGAWSASFLSHHPLGVGLAEPLMFLPKSPTRRLFVDWVERAAPDVVLAPGVGTAKWLEAVPAMRRPEFATLSWSVGQPNVPGLDQQSDVLGATAVELLVDQIHRNEQGVPDSPKLVMTAGVWRKSATVAAEKLIT